MAKKFPLDEFDFVTRQGGIHRASIKMSDRLVGLVKYLASVAVISGAGILGLTAFSASNQVNGQVTTAPTSNVVAEEYNADGLGVTVIDSTTQKGFAFEVAQGLLDKGWNVYGAADAGPASGGTDFKKTTVYYSVESSKAAAEKLLADLGDYQIKQSSFFSDPLTVVLAKDYK
jgi:hypothetical protein